MRIVTGPPRSGTSLVCQLLTKLGADFRSDLGLLEADRWNPEGYFESKPIIDLNHRLMFNGIGNSKDWIDSDWQTDKLRDLRKLLTGLMLPLTMRPSAFDRRTSRLMHEIEQLARLFHSGFAKDPRFCVTMSAWMKTGMIDAALICWRMPLTTAASIARQTGYPKSLMRPVWADSLSRFLSGMKPSRLFLLSTEKLTQSETYLSEMPTIFSFAGVEYSEERAKEVWRESVRLELRHIETQSGLSHREARVLEALNSLKA